MAQLNYEIPDDLHKALKIRAAEQGITLKALIITYLIGGEEWAEQEEQTANV